MAVIAHHADHGEHADPGARIIERYCDVAVVGGSAAGLAGALQLARQRRAVIVVDDGTPRNAPAEHMHGYLGREGAAPSELVAIGRDEVRSYGGDPETSSGLGGALHRRWVDLKSLVTGKDDKSILNECERGEDVAVRSYRTALEKNLPVDVRSVVERQYQGVLQNHDQVKRLREQFKNA